MSGMAYISTRGKAEALDFAGVLLAGLARDGGLYVPQRWPALDGDALGALRGRSYAEVAHAVMRPYVGGAIGDQALREMIEAAYGPFDHALVAPLVQIGANQWLMELWHGPTLAFKDVAMQLLGRLYDHVLAERGERVTLIGATSGDTGSAAIEAIRHCERARIFILHPHNRTSEVQRRQMTTVDAPNVHNIAVEGTFDDCQALVKAMFGDAAFRDEHNLSGVNSINWARVCPQIVYYVHAAVALGAPDVAVSFAVPTGNFGDIYAGYAARQMGVPIRRLVIASNVNDILTRALTTGDHALSDVVPTMSPSMDIQVSSNFERLLFDMLGRDGEAVEALMGQLRSERRFAIDGPVLERMRAVFGAYRVDEAQTLAVMQRMYERTGELIDPHTAVGVGAAWRAAEEADATDRATPMVVLSTAHPAKFPDAVEKATAHRPPLPEHLADLYERPERYTVLPSDEAAVKAFVRDNGESGGGGAWAGGGLL